MTGAPVVILLVLITAHVLYMARTPREDWF